MGKLRYKEVAQEVCGRAEILTQAGSQAAQYVILTNHLMCCCVDTDRNTHRSHSLC